MRRFSNFVLRQNIKNKTFMELKNIKKYSAMSAEEQERWVKEFAEWMPKGQQLAKISSGWTKSNTVDMEQGLRLLVSWPIAEEYCETAAHFGDYDRRAYRINVYIEKVVNQLADGLTIHSDNGRQVLQVSPSTPLRRRGRPTKEEIAARLRGEELKGNDAEVNKMKAIAQLLGVDIVVSGNAPREKNNAELKAERDARRAEEAKQNPTLFAPAEPAAATVPCASTQGPQGSPVTKAASPCAQLMSDSYEMRMAQDKLHLDQLAWMCSKSLQERIKMIQGQRSTAESASERAKMLAEMGGKQKDIAEYAEQAKVATEAYLQTYADIDEELAILHKRLYLDLPFIEKFKQRFKGVDIEKIQYITRPYYEKVKSPELDIRIKAVIEQENPEYAAKMKAEEAKKKEVSELLRYLKRKDKPNVEQRINTMEKRYQRLIELLGEDEAKVYRPIVDAAIADYEKNYKKPTVVSDSTADNKPVPSVAIVSQPQKSQPQQKEQPKKKATKKTTSKKTKK